MIVLGIDPGIRGAIAQLSDDMLVIQDMPILMLQRGGKKKPQIDVHVLSDMIEVASPDHAFLEDAWGRPGEAPSAAFTNGRNFGAACAVLAALQVPYTVASPQRWKKALRVPAEKSGARARASQLLPQYASEWRRVKDDGRAESALIALYGRQVLRVVQS